MSYGFDKVTDRRASRSLKWNVGERELPMWVADMDFPTAPAVRAAIEQRAAHGVFGYTEVSDDWYDAYVGWWSRRHGFTPERDWLIFCTGVVPAISSIVRKLTTPAEKVLIQTPVYNIFFNSIVNNGRYIVESPLVCGENGYEIDFDDLESKLADPQTSLMLLCNPHNPVGKLWDAGTLARIGELCAKHHVTVVSDEIHCDLTAPGKSYVPFASVSDTCREISVTCAAPTKTFNLAGLQTAAVIVPNELLRHRVWRGLNTDEVAEPNVFAEIAAVAAFNEGEEWLDELRAYLWENKAEAVEFCRRCLPQVKVEATEATYLLWLDCRAVKGYSSELCGFIRERTGLYLSEGSHYGDAGSGFLRMNIACPRSVLADGLDRLRTGITEFERRS